MLSLINNAAVQNVIAEIFTQAWLYG